MVFSHPTSPKYFDLNLKDFWLTKLFATEIAHKLIEYKNEEKHGIKLFL